ncbi:MAG: DUF2752 domain-containing protein [Actinomycetota bacterium]
MTATTLLPESARSLLASPTARLAAGAAAFVTAAVTSSSDDGVVICPFRRCTGGYCPGCGLTRSSGQLIRGDLVGSWQRHPFIIIGLVQLVALVGLWRTAPRLWSAVRGRANGLVLANVALLVAIWAARLASGAVPLPSYLTGPFG